MGNDYNGLFTPSGVTEQQPRNTELYRVNYKASKSGKYTSVVRFIPFYKNPAKNIVAKFVTYVKNPVTGTGLYIDDPRTVGKPSPVNELYWKMQNTNIATYQEFAKKNLGSKQQYASLVQILKDDIHPELVGQIKVFVYGKKIFDKLHSEEHPENGQAGINPFDPFRGRKFAIVCENVSDYNNFDKSAFYDEKDPTGTQVLPSGIWYINPETQNYEIAVESMPEKNRQYLVDYLAANSPDLDNYEYQDWTQEQIAHVNEVLTISNNYLSTGSLGATSQIVGAGIQSMFAGQPTATPGIPQPAAPVVFPGATSLPGGVAAPVAPVAPATPAAPVAAPVAAPTAPVAPVAPVAAPAAPVAPVAPVAAPAAPQSVGFAPVAAPAVTPATAPVQAATPAAGMNVDDILNNL